MRRIIYIILITLFISIDSIAQPAPCPIPGACKSALNAPINDNIIFLVMAAIAYGIYLYNKKTFVESK